jgi:uncharacterized protein
MIEYSVIFFIAFFVSIISGVLGLGGAFLLIPAYLYLPSLFNLSSLDIKIITGLTSIQVFASSLLGAVVHRRKGGISESLLLTIGLPMASVALLGAYFSKFVSGEFLIILFAIMALIGAVMMFIKPHPSIDEVNPEKIFFNKKLAVIIAVLVGFMGGMMGAPGAFILAPLMIAVLKIPVRITIGSTLGIVLFTSFTASIGKVLAGQVDFLITSIAVAGSLIGVVIGSSLSHKIKPKNLRYALAFIIAGIAVEMLIKVLE